jgi:hypothetical protein
MGYSLQDLYNFHTKDGKTQISISLMNAFNAAVSMIVAKEGKITVKAVLKLRDELFEENQAKMEIEHKKWMEKNNPASFVQDSKVISEKLKEADMPSIQQGENPEIPIINIDDKIN